MSARRRSSSTTTGRAQGPTVADAERRSCPDQESASGNDEGAVRSDSPLVLQCPRQESNLRPLVPETNALSPELRRRTDRGYHRTVTPPDGGGCRRDAARLRRQKPESKS